MASDVALTTWGLLETVSLLGKTKLSTKVVEVEGVWEQPLSFSLWIMNSKVQISNLTEALAMPNSVSISAIGVVC